MADVFADESGFTGADLLSDEQPVFAYASVQVSDEKATGILRLEDLSGQSYGKEVKGSSLLKSARGRRHVIEVFSRLDCPFYVTVHDKKFALGKWFFEFVFEPVFHGDDLNKFYKAGFNDYVACNLYYGFIHRYPIAMEIMRQFQLFARSGKVGDAPFLFDFSLDDYFASLRHNSTVRELSQLRLFASRYRDTIQECLSKERNLFSQIRKYSIDLSFVSLVEHLGHWGHLHPRFRFFFDESKPLLEWTGELDEDGYYGMLREAHNRRWSGGPAPAPFKVEATPRDSFSSPGVQLADLIAACAVRLWSDSEFGEDLTLVREAIEARTGRVGSLLPRPRAYRFDSSDARKVNKVALETLALAPYATRTIAALDSAFPRYAA